MSNFENMFPILQILLLFLTSYLFFIGVSNPNPTTNNDHVANEGVIGFFMVAIGPRLAKSIILISTLSQMIYFFLQIFPNMSNLFLFAAAKDDDHFAMTLQTTIGYSLMIIGGLGRIWCYRTLGKFFTYEITIQNSHQLIQSGPYAYVRHPSYTSIYMVTAGMFLIHRRSAMFLPNKPWIQMQFGLGGFMICLLIQTILILRRVGYEERELRTKFGREWLKYASTRRRFIPGLI